jgi:hypothetical protein
MNAKDFIRPADNLLYRAKGIFGWVIALKTWHPIAHCEGYIGGGKSVASRDGVGVGIYDLRLSELRYIMRPRLKFDLDAAMRTFASRYQGQGYDWLGLLRFASREPVSATRFNNLQFCSELLTRWDRAGGLDPFNGEDADAIAPFQFLTSNAFRRYEVKDGEVLEPAR